MEIHGMYEYSNKYIMLHDRWMCYLIYSWQYPEYFSCASGDDNITAYCIQNIHTLSLSCFPRSGSESIWFWRESSNWTEVDNIPGEFRKEELLNIRSHLWQTTESAKYEETSFLLLCSIFPLATLTVPVPSMAWWKEKAVR